MEKMNRRNLFKLGAYAIASLPLFKSIKSFASDIVPLNACPVSPEGKFITGKKKLAVLGKSGYVSNAAQAKGNDKYTAGAACGNCKFYGAKFNGKTFKASKEIKGHAKCPMVANGYVNRCGWCTKYKPGKGDQLKYQAPLG
jgi:hypothetical protein